jgi:hypothetical protein
MLSVLGHNFYIKVDILSVLSRKIITHLWLAKLDELLGNHLQEAADKINC